MQFFLTYILIAIAARVWNVRPEEAALRLGALPVRYRFGRPATHPRHVSTPLGALQRPEGNVPVRLEAMLQRLHAQLLRWNMHYHEKRNYYQLHGERTPYRHS